jgi:hypothetical protein
MFTMLLVFRSHHLTSNLGRTIHSKSTHDHDNLVEADEQLIDQKQINMGAYEQFYRRRRRHLNTLDRRQEAHRGRFQGPA